jgi:hypothetical protein
MAAKIKKYMLLLALASPPGASSTILEWVPFPPGLTIGELIEKHNQACYAYYKKIPWDDELIEDWAYGITVVQDSLSNLGELRRKTLEDIDIVIMDLGSVSGIPNEVARFAKKIAPRKRPFYISQVANSPAASSALGPFDTLPAIPSQPPILQKQPELENYLECFYVSYGKAVDCIRQAPLPGGGSLGDRGDSLRGELGGFLLTSSHRKLIPKLASELRDAVQMKNLTEKQTEDLARLAVGQEYRFANLSKQIELKSGTHVGMTGFNPVRKTILELDAQRYRKSPQLKTTRFLCLSLARDPDKLTDLEQRFLGDLGITKRQTAVVQFDKTTTRSLLDKIAGQVKVTEFKDKGFV